MDSKHFPNYLGNNDAYENFPNMPKQYDDNGIVKSGFLNGHDHSHEEWAQVALKDMAIKSMGFYTHWLKQEDIESSIPEVWYNKIVDCPLAEIFNLIEALATCFYDFAEHDEPYPYMAVNTLFQVKGMLEGDLNMSFMERFPHY